MRRVRLGIVGAGRLTEGAILPALSGPDVTSPPDGGAWWQRQSGGSADISYQAPIRPEIVAIADERDERAQRVGQAARVRAIYSDWRAMLREVSLDVLICAVPPDECAKVLWDAHARALPSPLWMWLPGAPAPTARDALGMAASTMALRVWCARPLRQAAAHRAARRLIERGEIGRVTALALRWPAAFFRREANPKTDGAALSSNYAALDLVLGMAALSHDRARPSSVQVGANFVVSRESGGATNVLLGFENGVSATALFSAAEEANAPWPRLEICGSHGKSIVCESGRQLQLFEPREPTRTLLPPNDPGVSTANLLGIAEDLKAFFSAWSESNNARQAAPKYFPDLASAVRVLETLEAIDQTLRGGANAESRADAALVLADAVQSRRGGAARADENHVGQLPGASQNAVLPLYD